MIDDKGTHFIVQGKGVEKYCHCYVGEDSSRSPWKTPSSAPSAVGVVGGETSDTGEMGGEGSVAAVKPTVAEGSVPMGRPVLAPPPATF